MEQHKASPRMLEIPAHSAKIEGEKTDCNFTHIWHINNHNYTEKKGSSTVFASRLQISVSMPTNDTF